MKILLFGGSGLLGKELLKLNPAIIAPTSSECNIANLSALSKWFGDIMPDLVIHAAAMTDNREVEKRPDEAIEANIIGTSYIAMLATYYKTRVVYLSTDYIYKGDRGNYKETDEILPFNLYSWTKLGGECAVKCVENHLIIRTSFGAKPFTYDKAFVDKYTSKDYVEVLTPMIYEAATSPLTGVLNLGTERKTLYNHAAETKTVEGIKLNNSNFFTPVDTSLNLRKWIDFKTYKEAVSHTNCRACNSDKMIKYLDLGLMPLPNNLEFTSKRVVEADRFPLQVALCSNCSLSQLTVDVNKETMFSHYLYRSSINTPYVAHCREMAEDLKQSLNLSENSFHIDIAGNDGALLKEFKDVIGIRVLNVDPASNLTAIGDMKGVPCVTKFWGYDTAVDIISEHGTADLITATNVLAHVPSMQDFIHGVRAALKKEGVCVVECPYLVDLIEKMEYDTIYAEHASYISIAPLNLLCDNAQLKIIEVSKQKIHGGSVRIKIAHKASSHEIHRSVSEFITAEKLNGFDGIEKYTNWAKDVADNITQFGTELLHLKKQGYKIAGMGASAKGNTLLNSAKINTDIVDYIIDETPQKIGLFSPGTGIPVVGMDILQKKHPEYIIILAWNFSEVLISKLRAAGYEGKIIIPIPKFEVI